MPSIEFGCQQSNVPDIEMVPGLLDEYFCDNDSFQSFGNNDLFQSFSDKLGIPLKPEETVEKSVKDALSLSTFKELGFNFAQNNSEYLFEETSEVKNAIKSEPQSPNAQDFMSSANLVSTSYSESSDSDGQITSSMQDVSESMENFTLETSLLSPLQYTISSPQSSQASSDISNATQQFNVTQKTISINQQDIKDTDITYAKADNTEHLMWSHIANDGKPNTINFATVLGYTAKLKQTSSSTCQVLPRNESINVQNSPSVESIGIKTGTTSFQLPQNMKIINTISNIRAANNTKSVDTSSILNNDSMVCNIVTSEPINTSFQLMQNKKSPSPLILTDDLMNLPKKIVNDQECKLKALKRQQRMIKNRESACLSRKKRKEYVSSLERQVFELKEENKQLKSENDVLKQRLTEMENSIIHENNKSNNLSLESLAKTKTKKKIAFALCIAIVISFNVNNFRETFSQSNVHFKAKPDNLPITMPEIIHTRRLLWTVDENNNMDPVNENFNKSIPIHPVCPMYINQSESIRLDSELRRWIDGESDKDNRTTSKGTKLETDSLKIISRSSLAERPKKRLYLSRDRKIKTMHKMIDIRPADHYSINNNAVEVFSPILSEYASLFEALGRKDDTFYVVWFSGEHLLLPASRKNDTARPKMSLVLPAVSINGTFPTPPNHITMMQIDCEVTNTQLLHLQQSIIPVHLRNSKSTNQSSRSHSVEDMIDPYVANLTRNYKPYFMKEANRKQRYKKDIA